MEASIREGERGGGRQTALESASCRTCGDAFPITERLMIGEVLSCPRCATPHEVAALHPPRVERLRRIEEDPEDFQDFELF